MIIRDVVDKLNKFFSNVVVIIGISLFIVSFCAACAILYKIVYIMVFIIKGTSIYYDFSSKAFWFDKDFYEIWIKGMIGCFLLLAIGFIGFLFEERRKMKKVNQNIDNLDINRDQKITQSQIQSKQSSKMSFKTILGGILVAFSGPCLPILYREGGGDPFINWIMLSLASLILIFGSLILAKGIKEYLK